MRNRITYYVIFVNFAFILFWQNSASGEPMRVTENLRNETVQLPSSAPDQEQDRGRGSDTEDLSTRL